MFNNIMIGIAGNIARVVATQAGREAMEVAGQRLIQRLVAGEALENISQEELLRRIGKRLAQAGAGATIREIKREMARHKIQEEEGDARVKNIDWNARMNDFARNLNGHYRQNTTLYKEERNVANKEKVEDRFGLSNAYKSPTGLYKTGKTLYTSGTTGKDGSITQDILDDLIHLPTRNARKTEKYKDVMEELKNSPEITRLVGHSLASAVINTINEDQPNKFSTTTYATPTIKPKRKGKQNP